MENNTIIINSRKSVIINGVKSVRTFDEDFVCVDTDLGKLFIEGTDMRIEELEKSKGELFLSGEIRGVSYEAEKKSKSFFKSNVK